MSDCTYVRDNLLFYLLGELTTVQMAAVGKHLSRCDACAREARTTAADISTISRAMQEAPIPLAHSISDEIVTQLPLNHPPQDAQRFRWLTRRVAVAAATVAIAVVVLVTIVLHTHEPQKVAAASFVGDHRKNNHRPSAAWVVSANPAIVGDWLSREMGYRVRPPDLLARGASLLGGLRCSVDGAPAALMFYEKGRNRITLFQTRAAVDFSGLVSRLCDGHWLRLGQYDELRLVACSTKEQTIIAVASLPEAELIKMVQMAASAAPRAGALRVPQLAPVALARGNHQSVFWQPEYRRALRKRVFYGTVMSAGFATRMTAESPPPSRRQELAPVAITFWPTDGRTAPGAHTCTAA